MISLPFPPDVAGSVSVAHPAAAMQPVAWWKRRELARRAIVYVVDDAGVPDELRLTDEALAQAEPSEAWDVRTELTLERRSYTRHAFSDIEGLRGVPAEECVTAQAELLLRFGGRTLVLQAGGTGPRGGPYYWESVQVDPLWRNAVAQAFRVGGVIYNEDTYLFLVLFCNGVADVAAHFVNTKLHIKGYDFQGLPMIRFAGDAVAGQDATVPGDGLRFELGRTNPVTSGTRTARPTGTRSAARSTRNGRTRLRRSGPRGSRARFGSSSVFPRRSR